MARCQYALVAGGGGSGSAYYRDLDPAGAAVAVDGGADAFALGTPVGGSVVRRGASPMVSLRASSETRGIECRQFHGLAWPVQRSWRECLTAAPPGPYQN